MIGSNYSLVAPAGATRLLLGINDDFFNDNSGAFSVTITGPDVGVIPEPATWALLTGGFGMAGGVLRRRAASVPARA